VTYLLVPESLDQCLLSSEYARSLRPVFLFWE
jgi:hypothetical protein